MVDISLDMFGGQASSCFTKHPCRASPLLDSIQSARFSPCFHPSALLLHNLLQVISSCSQGHSALRFDSFSRSSRDREGHLMINVGTRSDSKTATSDLRAVSATAYSGASV